MKFWWRGKRERGRKTNPDRQRHRETRRDTEIRGWEGGQHWKRHTCIVETGHAETSETGKESGRKRDIWYSIAGRGREVSVCYRQASKA